jgi:S-adenosylmethionine synthetase
MNVVAWLFARRSEVQLAYAIGVVEPLSVMVDTFGTCLVPEERIRHAIRKVFDLSPRGIIKALDLRTPIYRRTASGGHFGRAPATERVGSTELSYFSWERTDRIDDLRAAAGTSRG